MCYNKSVKMRKCAKKKRLFQLTFLHVIKKILIFGGNKNGKQVLLSLLRG